MVGRMNVQNIKTLLDSPALYVVLMSGTGKNFSLGRIPSPNIPPARIMRKIYFGVSPQDWWPYDSVL